MRSLFTSKQPLLSEDVITTQNPSYAVAYHAITTADTTYAYDVPIALFRTHLALFKEIGVECEVTFDDGHLSHANKAVESLEEFGIRGTFFVTLGWIGSRSECMGWQELGLLAKRGHRIGLHGWSHLMLTECSQEQLADEIVRPRAVLQDKLGLSADCLSMPGGRWNRRVLDACAEAGYLTAYTSDYWRPPFTHGRMSVKGRFNVTHKLSALQLASMLRTSQGLRSRAVGTSKYLLQKALGDRGYHWLWSVINGYNQKNG